MTERTLQNAAQATGDGLPLYVAGLMSAVVTVTLTGTAEITFEAQHIVGGSWSAILATNLSSGDEATTADASGSYRIQTAALYAIRARISAYTDGTVTAVGTAVDGQYVTPQQAAALTAYQAALAAASAGQVLTASEAGVAAFAAAKQQIWCFNDTDVIDGNIIDDDVLEITIGQYVPEAANASFMAFILEMEEVNNSGGYVAFSGRVDITSSPGMRRLSVVFSGSFLATFVLLPLLSGKIYVSRSSYNGASAAIILTPIYYV